MIPRLQRGLCSTQPPDPTSADTLVNSRLQSAIDALSIEDVSFRSISSSLAEGFEPKFDADVEELQVDVKHLVRGYEVVEVRHHADDKGQQLFRVLVDLGVRWSRPIEAGETADEADEGSNSAPDQLASIEALAVAEYAMDASPGDEALEQFALRNASFHVWPYWREYVSSQCYRMNLPRFLLPTRQFAPAQPEEDE